jgi:hypothetical protein
MSDVGAPNLVLPLASSYNERGIDGYATTITSGKDQRKINSIYEVVANAITGKRTLYLAKRPGISSSDSGTYGVSGDVPYLAISMASGTNPEPWFFTKNGTATKASNGSTTTTILTAATTFPSYITTTTISGTLTAVLQISDTTASPVFDQRSFYASDIASWTEITDADYTGLVHRGMPVHMDGYMFQMTSNNRIYNSDLNSLANWTSTSFITKQSETDVGSGLMRLGNIILAAGHATIEGFYNAGISPGSPLSRIKAISERIGLSHLAILGGVSDGYRHYYTTLGTRIYFAGRKKDALLSTSIFSFDGSRFERVSTDFIDAILSSGNNSFHIGSMVFYGKEAIYVLLTGPSTTPQRWLMFFPEWNDWFEWTSTYVQPVNDGNSYLGIGGTSSALTGTRFGGSGSTKFVDGFSSAITLTHQFKLPASDNERKAMDMFGLVGDTATAASTVSVEFSDDDYVTFQTARSIDMTKKIKEIYRCGNYRDRAVRITHTGDVEFRASAVIARIR